MSEAAVALSGATTTHYEVERIHDHDEGLIQLPIAGTHPQLASLVRLNAPMETETIVWSALRRGCAPVVPSWKSFIVGGNANRIFLGGQRSVQIPVPTIGGGHWFVVAGWYRYAILAEEGLDSDFATGNMPWETFSPETNFIPKEYFSPTGILGTALPASLPSPYFNPFLPPKTPLEPVQPARTRFGNIIQGP